MRQQSSPVRRYQIEVVAKAIDVLEALAGHPQGLSLSEMAARVRLPRSTVHRLVCTLQVKGLLVQATEHGRYALGLRLFQLGKEAEPQLAKAALPLMKELAAKFKETVSLGILEEGEVHYVLQVEGTHPIRFAGRPGMRGPLHATALGKAIAASLDRDLVKEIITAKPLRKFTASTVTQLAQFWAELDQVRRNQYAVDREEQLEGVRCVASPIRGGDGAVAGAISLSGPAARFTDKRMRAILRELVPACLRISGLLGHPSSR